MKVALRGSRKAFKILRTRTLEEFRELVATRLRGRIEMNDRNFNRHHDPDEREKARVRVTAYQNALNDLNALFSETTHDEDHR